MNRTRLHRTRLHRSRLQRAAALLAAAGLLAALTSCAPATTHHPYSAPKTSATPTPTPTPTTGAPKSRYPIGCDDLLPASAVATLYTTPMTPVEPANFDRLDLDPEIPQAYYIQALGGIDCAWYDGQKTSGNSRDLELSVLPATSAVWNEFVDSSEGVTGTTYTFCTSDEQNTCEYDAFVNGSWLYILANNLSVQPGSGNTTLPPQLKSAITAMTAKLTAAALGPAPALRQGSVTLPNTGTSLITAAQFTTALGLGGGVTVDCTGHPDGPWSLANEAETEVTSAIGCFFATSDGGGYGGYEWLAGGAWAAELAEAATPSETALTVPGLPAGDSAKEYSDSQGELTVDLILGGNWIEYELAPASDTGEPPGSVPLPTAAIALTSAFEKTVRG